MPENSTPLPDPAEIARNQRILDEFNARIRAGGGAAALPDGVPVPERFHNDHAGTAREGWELRGDTWYDANGKIVYVRGADGGWYDPHTGRLIYDRLGNKQI